MLTGRRPHSSLPQLPSSIGKNMETSRIHQELLRRQPTTSTGAMDLEPGQPVFVKEVNGNVWRTATVDQPAAEPDSYWVRFPDDSILRRTRSMIKTKVFTFSFWASGWSTTEELWRRKELTFLCNLQPVEWTINVACYTNGKCDQSSNSWDRGSKVSETPDPINSTGAPQPTGERGAISSTPSTPRRSTRSTKGVPPVHYTPSRKWMDYSDILCVQVVQWK